MRKHLITAAIIGLLVGTANRSEADILYDACHKPLATGGTVVLSNDGKTFTYTTCDKQVTQTYSLDSYSFERGKVCMKQEAPSISCKAKFSCKAKSSVSDGSKTPRDSKTYTPSCKPKK